MDKTYRIKANVGGDKILNVKLQQGIDMYELLSLKLRQESLYKLHSSNYGVIVGRVLANDAFGVPNAKVSVFIPLKDEDAIRNDLKAIYPYKNVTDVNSKNIRFNTLPNYNVNDCHRAVGSMPSKRMVLDDDSVLEMYDKYYKYTTVTNNAGDYMIFGVPTGEHLLHVDVDLSDIGILSQKPRDFISKGYSMNMFDSPTQFKKSTNLNDLAQIHTENLAITVYPFWGDKDANEITITRKDINLQYKFETSCVFIGSVVTDGSSSSIGHNCVPEAGVGEAGQLTPSEGTIEMIRKTIDDKVEEFPIMGNQLIDSDGVFCYQIPMNLDYVGMDEYGNIVPTDNPSKGIPTRSRVRFRFTLNETGGDSLTQHKARYLVPNNPPLDNTSVRPAIEKDYIDTDAMYEFGTLTHDDCFRDLYWNKVYSVKSYIPRLQTSKFENTSEYLAIKGVNKKDAKQHNIFPFNKLNLNFSIPAYHNLYTLSKGNKGVAGYWKYLKSNYVNYSIDAVRESIIEESDAIGLDFYNDWINGCLYFPLWFWRIRAKKKYKEGESIYDSSLCECNDEKAENHVYLYNSCSLPFSNSTDSKPFEINKNSSNVKAVYKDFSSNMSSSFNYGSKKLFSGVIKKKHNKDGAEIYYYSFGNSIAADGNVKDTSNGKYLYARLFSTDIILLGSLVDNDFDGIPQISSNIPSTTAIIPPLGRAKEDVAPRDKDVKEQVSDVESEYNENNIVLYNGMNWGEYWNPDEDRKQKSTGEYKFKYGSGLFFGLNAKDIYHGWDPFLGGWGGIIPVYNVFAAVASLFGVKRRLNRTQIYPTSDIKSCVNAERICELGVTLDSSSNVNVKKDENTNYIFAHEMDGLITKDEIEDVDSRALFATLNYNKLIGELDNSTTGYKSYRLTYLYPTNFDGKMSDIAPSYTNSFSHDVANIDYVDFRFGSAESDITYTTERGSFGSHSLGPDRQMVRVEGGGNMGGRRSRSTIAYEVAQDYIIDEGGGGGGRGSVSVKYTSTASKKVRHFYGYNTIDYIYPAHKNRKNLNNMDYAFPLYENSFYFYFGMNQGSTAIDKFYNKFFSKCYVTKEYPFLLSLSSSAATACDENSGIIDVDVQEIAMPYTVKVKKKDTTIDEINNINTYTTSLSGLANATYTVDVTDAYGATLSEDITLAYQRITLRTSVERAIDTEYIGQTTKSIYENNQYAKVVFNSYSLYGTDYTISNLTPDDAKAGLYSLGKNVKMVISPKNGGNIIDYMYQGRYVQSGTTLVICKPGVFNVEVYEVCGNLKSNNIAYYTITIGDTKMLELLLNEVPVKFLVGLEKDKLPYNKYFYNNGETITSADDVSVKGWFGLNNPETYDTSFKAPFDNDLSTIIWNELVNGEIFEAIRYKLESMFKLCAGAYITSYGDNKFTVELENNISNSILRTAHPLYGNLSTDNSETNGSFTGYYIGSDEDVTANAISPNIVSENYRLVSEDEGIPNEESAIEGKLFDFNPKYKDAVNTAGNYFAGFSDGANIEISLEDGECNENKGVKPYRSLPKGAHSLCKGDYHMCIGSEVEEDSPYDVIYKEKRYMRTEFIDRRFDYNFLYITPYKTPNNDAGVWSNGRVSGITYNGIDMAYDDTTDRNIVSENDSTEYNYKTEDATVTLNNSLPKRFYESSLTYANGMSIDLRDAYKYGQNQSPFVKDASIVNNNTVDVTKDEYQNFGLNGDVIKGYPSKKLLDVNNIPYGDSYSFKNVSCSYNGINVSVSSQKVKASALPGETVSHSIETNGIVSLITNSFDKDYASDNFNIDYGEGSTPLTLSMKFNIVSNGSNGFKSKVKNGNGALGVRLLSDTMNHNVLNYIKTETSLESISSFINSSTLYTYNDYPVDKYDTTDDFKSYEFECKNIAINGAKYVPILIDRYYYSTSRDSLLKRIRAINLSTIYRMSNITFDKEVKTWKKEMKTTIDKDTVKVEVSGSGSSTSGGGKDGEQTTSSYSFNGSGGATSDPTGNTEDKLTWTVFTIGGEDEYFVNSIEDLCVKINYEEVGNYKLSEMKTEINGSTIKLDIVWDKHKKSLADDGGKATLDFFIKHKDGLVSHFKRTI